MKKVILILVLIFCGSVFSIAQQKSKVYATMFRHQIKAPSSKENVIGRLTERSKWKLDTAMRVSISNADRERWFSDATFRAEQSKIFMAFQTDGKCQLNPGNGQILNGTYRVEAVKDAFSKETTPTNDVEKKKKEQMDKIIDKSVQHETGSNDYFLYINVPGMPTEAKFEIQMMAGNRMILYIDEADSVTQWLGRPEKSKYR
jgi:predicted Abi (CAAX) family protease